MAQNYATQFRLALKKNVTTIYAYLKANATPQLVLQQWNPTTQTYSAAGTGGYMHMLSCVNQSTGDYIFTLGAPQSTGNATYETYCELLDVTATFDTSVTTSSPGTAPTAPCFWIKGNTVGSNGQIEIVFSATPTGAGLEPRAGEIVRMAFDFANAQGP